MDSESNPNTHNNRPFSPRASVLLSHLSSSSSDARQNPVIKPESLLSTPSNVKNGIVRAKINYPQLITSIFVALLSVTFLIKYQPPGAFVKILNDRMLLPVRDKTFTGSLQQPLVLITSQERGGSKLSTKIPNLVVTLYNRIQLVSMYNFRLGLRSLVDMGSSSKELAQQFSNIASNDSFFVKTIAPPVNHAIASVSQNTIVPIKRVWRLNIDNDPLAHKRDSADPLPYHTAILDVGLDLTLLNQHLLPLWSTNIFNDIPPVSCNKLSGWNVVIVPTPVNSAGDSGYLITSVVCHANSAKYNIFVSYEASSGKLISHYTVEVPEMTSIYPTPVRLESSANKHPLSTYLKSPYFDSFEIGHDVNYYLKAAKLNGFKAVQKMHPTWALPDAGVFTAPNFITFFGIANEGVDVYIKNPSVEYGPSNEEGCFNIYYVSNKGNLKTVHYCETNDVSAVKSSFSIKKTNLGYKAIKDVNDDNLDDVSPGSFKPVLLFNKGRYEPIYFKNGLITKLSNDNQGWTVRLSDFRPHLQFCNEPSISVHALSQTSAPIMVVSCFDDIIFFNSETGEMLIYDELPPLAKTYSMAEIRSASEEFLVNNLDLKNIFHGPILSLNPEEEQTLFVRRGNLMNAYIYLKPSFRLINRIGEYFVCIIIVTSVTYFLMHLVRNFNNKDN